MDGKSLMFKGIPYAQAPVGNLRWAPPKLWENPDKSKVIDALHFRNICPQGDIVNFLKNGETFGDEDCLFLNIFSPALMNKTAQTYPVALFIHGGSFRKGTTKHCEVTSMCWILKVS